MVSFLNKLTAKRYLMMMNIAILTIHASLLLLFTILQVRLMVCVNVFSIICYCVCFILVNKECVAEYVFVTIVEILIHAFLAIWCLGFGSGFQFYYIGCVPIIMCAQYFSVHLGVKPINGTAMSAVCAIVYVVSMIFDRSHTPMYSLNEGTLFHIAVANSALLFVFNISFYTMLTNIVSGFETELSKMASYDSLTGLMNRHYLTKYMNEILQNDDVGNYWIGILDIDDFKKVNDQYGHLCGDFVLCSMAEILKECCGENIVCRWGGEEFMIVGINSGQENDASILLEKIRSTIEAKEFIYNGTKLHLTVTIGTAYYDKDQTLDAWINTADIRLYNGKQTGKNQVISVSA